MLILLIPSVIYDKTGNVFPLSVIYDVFVATEQVIKKVTETNTIREAD